MEWPDGSLIDCHNGKIIGGCYRENGQGRFQALPPRRGETLYAHLPA